MRELGETAQELRGGPDPERVVEVWAPSVADGRTGRRGSGYRVGERWVLTTAHLVRGERQVDVRADTHRSARVALCSDRADVALLEFMKPAEGGPPPTYGAVPETDAGLPFTASGFPLFTQQHLHTAHRSRHAPCHTAGTLSAPAGRREGALELAVPPPDSDPDPHRSPWEGMSGAAVWHDGTLIGMVGAHHRSDGLGRLAAVRVDHWYGLLTGAELALLHEHAGLPPTPAGLARTRTTAPPSDPERPISLAALPDKLPLRELDGLVTALTALPSVSDRDGLALILDSIDPVISAMSPRAPALRPDVFGILSTCLRYRGTLDQLLEAIRLMEGDSVGVARMDQEAMELSRRHR